MPSADATKKENGGREREKERDMESERERESAEGSLDDIIDMSAFEQILEMDDDEDEREFSRAIVFGFMKQAIDTFSEMEDRLDEKDLAKLSSLGHFLKGSSATIGLTKVKDYCEKIQNFGMKKDETGVSDLSDESVCLSRIRSALGSMRKEYIRAEKHLNRFYGL